MGQINVSINHQTYSLACRDGEEERLAALARKVDEKARDLAGRLGHVGEARLMLMVALLFADELEEPGNGRAERRASLDEDEAVRLMEEASAEIEGIVSRLGNA